MFSPDDTVVAVATPPGRGGLGVVRISGPAARAVAESLLRGGPRLQPRHATLATIHGANEPAAIDRGVVTFFEAPHSYTGDDVVEISAHGSPVVLRAIVDAAIHAGARLAEPGEFTLRAFLNGRIDLVQAEAVADLVDAVTPLQARAAFDQLQGTLTGAISAIDRDLFDLAARLEASIDFPEEGFHFVEADEAAAGLAHIRASLDRLLADARRGRLIREGLQVVIAGKPNVGKSTLFNRLVGADRAIVSRMPGTTRDAVVEQADLAGVRVTLVDTAGIRQDAADDVEIEGVRRARKAIGIADLTMVVLDRSRPLDESDRAVLDATAQSRRLVIVNKIDVPSAWPEGDLSEESRLAGEGVIRVSLTGDDAVDEIRRAVHAAFDAETWTTDTPALTNVRHAALLSRARDAVVRACDTLDANRSTAEELILFEIADARAALEEVSGRRTLDDLLRHIFERFCVGK
jgi:tRNA modification GTPase